MLQVGNEATYINIVATTEYIRQSIATAGCVKTLEWRNAQSQHLELERKLTLHILPTLGRNKRTEVKNNSYCSLTNM